MRRGEVWCGEVGWGEVGWGEVRRDYVMQEEG